MSIVQPLGFQVIAVPATDPAPKPGLMRRLFETLFETLFEAREKHARHAVDQYIAESGGRLTDSIEREIGERILEGGVKFRN
jgi:hypothetical protein